MTDGQLIDRVAAIVAAKEWIALVVLVSLIDVTVSARRLSVAHALEPRG